MLNSSNRHHGQTNPGYGGRSLITACALSALLAATGCYSTPPSTRESAALSDASTFPSVDPVEGARSFALPTTAFRLPDRGERDYGESGESDEFDEFDEFEDAEEVFDPLSGYSRVMYHFNDRFYLWLWRPVAKGYRLVVPEPARVAVDRAYKNFRTPVRFANSLFQLKFKKSGTELGRLLLNSTSGIGGLFDPAEKFLGWRAPSPEDFGQTLGFYGVGGGFPVVLPLLGPTNVRDGVGMVPDAFMSPVVYFVSIPVSVGIASGKQFNRSSLHIGEYESFKKDALDPYTFFRDAYEQHREKQIQE